MYTMDEILKAVLDDIMKNIRAIGNQVDSIESDKDLTCLMNYLYSINMTLTTTMQIVKAKINEEK